MTDKNGGLEQLKAAFRAGMANTTNRELIALYAPKQRAFSRALREVIEAHDDEQLKCLGLLAAMHTDIVDSWLDASLEHSVSDDVLQLANYWRETTASIVAALKRPPADEAGEEWKN